MKRVVLSLLLVISAIVGGCTDDADGSAAPQIEDGGAVPAEQ